MPLWISQLDKHNTITNNLKLWHAYNFKPSTMTQISDMLSELKWSSGKHNSLFFDSIVLLLKIKKSAITKNIHGHGITTCTRHPPPICELTKLS